MEWEYTVEFWLFNWLVVIRLSLGLVIDCWWIMTLGKVLPHCTFPVSIRELPGRMCRAQNGKNSSFRLLQMLRRLFRYWELGTQLRAVIKAVEHDLDARARRPVYEACPGPRESYFSSIGDSLDVEVSNFTWTSGYQPWLRPLKSKRNIKIGYKMKAEVLGVQRADVMTFDDETKRNCGVFVWIFSSSNDENLIESNYTTQLDYMCRGELYEGVIRWCLTWDVTSQEVLTNPISGWDTWLWLDASWLSSCTGY